MHFSKSLLTAAVAGLTAFAAAAQQTPAPADEAAQKSEAEPTRLPDIEQTVNELLREEGEPAGQPPAEAATPPAEAPAEAVQVPAETPAAETAPVAAPATPAATPALATPSAASQPAPALTREQIATLNRTVARGRLLNAIARAGSVATQDMLTRLSDPNGAGISGWIAEPAGNAMLVTFYAGGEGDSAPRAVYRATVLGGRVTSREIFLGADRPALTPVEARMTAARAASDSGELQACTTQPFNVLVVPPASAAVGVDVYRLSAPARRGRIPVGGHFQSTVAADGGVENQAFASGCAEIEAVAPTPGQPPQPIGVVYPQGPLPTEIHMLLAQSAGRPLLVVTGEPQRIWLVTGEGIAQVTESARR